METILPRPQWPLALANFVTWCLMWDPKNRPTSAQAMNHEYFTDAVDPLRPRSSATRLLGRKHSSYDARNQKENSDSAPSARTSWFRKSLISRENASVIPQHIVPSIDSSINTPVQVNAAVPVASPKPRPNVAKRATWANGVSTGGAPMPILPSIRPISPLSNSVTAQASTVNERTPEKGSKKIGRQLSVASHQNHYPDHYRQDHEKQNNVNSGLASPTSGVKEGFFSHLRKRARRFSGRNQIPNTPKYDDIEANASSQWIPSNRSSVAMDTQMTDVVQKNDFTELDKALQNVRYGLDTSQQVSHQNPSQHHTPITLRKHHSLAQVHVSRPYDDQSPVPTASVPTASTAAVPNGLSSAQQPISSRTRRALQFSTHPAHRYETPDEEEELLDEALHGVQRAVRGIDRPRKPANVSVSSLSTITGRHANRSSVADNSVPRPALASTDSNRQLAHLQQTPAATPLHHSLSSSALLPSPYPTPSPSAKRNGILFGGAVNDEPHPQHAQHVQRLSSPAGTVPTPPLSITSIRMRPSQNHAHAGHNTMWPTPPSEENDWAAAATASIAVAGRPHYH